MVKYRKSYYIPIPVGPKDLNETKMNLQPKFGSHIYNINKICLI